MRGAKTEAVCSIISVPKCVRPPRSLSNFGVAFVAWKTGLKSRPNRGIVRRHLRPLPWRPCQLDQLENKLKRPLTSFVQILSLIADNLTER
jgi:hypothetical protein